MGVGVGGMLDTSSQASGEDYFRQKGLSCSLSYHMQAHTAQKSAGLSKYPTIT